MFEWNKSIQRMINCVEENLTETLTLEGLAELLNYSPYYCTKQFHKYTGISLRSYIHLRKLCSAVIDIRDSKERILDIALKYGFSSQEAFTRSFVKAYGITPSSYRKMPKPLPLLIKRNTYDPYFLGLGEVAMKLDLSKDVKVSIQTLPEHRFIGVRNINADNYFDFWTLQESIPGLDCHTVCGLLESIKSYNGQVGGWFYKDGRRGYLYGIEVPPDYNGEIPRGMECLQVPQSLYVIFHYPPYDYENTDMDVYGALQKMLESFNPKEYGYEYNNELPTYQRHDPANFGQAFCRPIKLLLLK